MKNVINLFCLLTICVWLMSCGGTPEKKCLLSPEVQMNISYQSLEDSLAGVKSKAELVKFFSRHLMVAEVFFHRRSYPSDSAFINHYYRWFSHPSMDTLLAETKKVFGNGEELRQEFQTAFANMKYYYPGFKPPHVITVISGLETDMFVSDSLVIVGLDYYLGKKAKYRPNMHQYMLSRFEKNYIVPSTLLLFGIDPRYNKTNTDDHTVLADMITYGKAYYFAHAMLPCAPDSIFIGYTGREIAGAEANQDVIWKKLVEEEAFFSTSMQLKQRYVMERPKTYEIGNECPGRIATWVGWKLVKEYMNENSSMRLPELMRIDNPQQIFKGAHYRPGE